MDDDDFAELFRKLPPSGSSGGTSWQDIAAELEGLGQTLGDVLRRAWQGQAGDPGLRRLREVLQQVVGDVDRAVEGTGEAQHARAELDQLIESIRAATARAADELRPELITLLRQANAELRRLTRLDD